MSSENGYGHFSDPRSPSTLGGTYKTMNQEENWLHLIFSQKCVCTKTLFDSSFSGLYLKTIPERIFDKKLPI